MIDFLRNMFPDEFFDDYDRVRRLRASPPEIRNLCDHLYELNNYFDDMRFCPGTITGAFCECKTMGTDGCSTIDQIPLPPEFDVFSPLWLNYHIMTPEEDERLNCEGYYSWEENELGVPRRNLNNDVVLLHELIHVHERLVNAFPIYYHDTLYWALYSDLKKKIPRIDEMITGHAHVLIGQSIEREGGAHGVLFLLKSLDLDIRMGWKLGTVFNFGYEDLFSGNTYLCDDASDE